jgi:hypothetical protein
VETTAVIMQPSCLPWLGYFDLVDQAGTFVFLDNVQFEKQSWQQRNRVRGHGGLEWLTVPVLMKGRSGQVISEVEINRSVRPDKFLRQVRQHYGRAPFFERYADGFEAVFTPAYEAGNLCEFNIALITWLCSCLSLATPMLRSSRLKAAGKRSGLLVEILREIGAARYLSPRGSSVYLEAERELFERQGISVAYQNFRHPEYRQVYKPFVPFASCIDLLFNEGERSLGIIRSGRLPATATCTETADEKL